MAILTDKEIDKIISTILYGDIFEVQHKILGKNCPQKGIKLDDEQYIRVSIAATIKKELIDMEVT